MAALTMRRQSSRPVTSPAHAEAMPPSDRITSTVSWARFTSRSTQSTRAPSRANRIAAALPLPSPGPRDPPPVTIATLPVSRPAITPWLFERRVDADVDEIRAAALEATREGRAHVYRLLDVLAGHAE